jgi:hypothetical protein
MICAEFEVILSDYVDGNVSVEMRRAIEQHADQCAACRELLRDVFHAVAFLERAEEVTPPPELITRIVYHAPQGRVRKDFESSGFLSRSFAKWLQPVLQPKFAMSMAMTILSFAMLGRCAGIQVKELKPADLNPVVLWNNFEGKGYRLWDRTVKYYENFRLVYEIETRLKEFRDEQDAARGAKNQTGNGTKPVPQEDREGGTRK